MLSVAALVLTWAISSPGTHEFRFLRFDVEKGELVCNSLTPANGQSRVLWHSNNLLPKGTEGIVALPTGSNVFAILCSVKRHKWFLTCPKDLPEPTRKAVEIDPDVVDLVWAGGKVCFVGEGKIWTRTPPAKPVKPHEMNMFASLTRAISVGSNYVAQADCSASDGSSFGGVVLWDVSGKRAKEISGRIMSPDGPYDLASQSRRIVVLRNAQIVDVFGISSEKKWVRFSGFRLKESWGQVWPDPNGRDFIFLIDHRLYAYSFTRRGVVKPQSKTIRLNDFYRGGLAHCGRRQILFDNKGHAVVFDHPDSKGLRLLGTYNIPTGEVWPID